MLPLSIVELVETLVVYLRVPICKGQRRRRRRRRPRHFKNGKQQTVTTTTMTTINDKQKIYLAKVAKKTKANNISKKKRCDVCESKSSTEFGQMQASLSSRVCPTIASTIAWEYQSQKRLGSLCEAPSKQQLQNAMSARRNLAVLQEFSILWLCFSFRHLISCLEIENSCHGKIGWAPRADE